MTDPRGALQAARDPWDRFGWVMGGVWLVFLGFPLAAALSGEEHWAARVAAVALIAVFAAVYVHGFVRLGRTQPWADVRRWGPRYVGVLIALVAAVAAAVGDPALGMATFVVAMGMFVLPLAAGLALFAGAIAVTAGVTYASDAASGQWMIVGIVVLVGIITLIVRQLDHHGARHRELTGALALAGERDRVARDVHDVLGHSLTVVTVKAELAERLVDVDPARAKAELAQIRALSRQALAEIRATVGGLRTANLDDELEAGRVVLDGAGILAEFPDDPSVVDPRHRSVLAWALREAVTNVVRHSAGARCRVELGTNWLHVRDDGQGLGDGQGFDDGQRLPGLREGNGLRGLRERVHAAGGAVTFGPGLHGAGAGVRIEL